MGVFSFPLSVKTGLIPAILDDECRFEIYRFLRTDTTVKNRDRFHLFQLSWNKPSRILDVLISPHRPRICPCLTVKIVGVELGKILPPGTD